VGAPSYQASLPAPVTYVFTRSGGEWTPQAALIAKKPGTNALDAQLQGWSVSLSADGNILAAGTPDQGNERVHVFTRTGDQWGEPVRVLPPSGVVDFAEAVSLSADGNTLAVGADSDVCCVSPPCGACQFSGAVYVYARDGADWSEQARVTASNPDPNDAFGRAVSLSATGNTLAVGAPWEDSPATGINSDQGNGMFDAGATYVFTRSVGDWSEQAYIKSSRTNGREYFGTSVSLSADGDTLAVWSGFREGAQPNMDGALIFTRNGTTWIQQALVAPATEVTDNWWSRGAQTVSLSADGDALVIGDFTGDTTTIGGVVYMFARSGSTWIPRTPFTANTPLGRYGFAVSLSADSSTLAVGATGEGGVYVYELD
jgi:hypothetical protein